MTVVKSGILLATISKRQSKNISPQSCFMPVFSCLKYLRLATFQENRKDQWFGVKMVHSTVPVLKLVYKKEIIGTHRNCKQKNIVLYFSQCIQKNYKMFSQKSISSLIIILGQYPTSPQISQTPTVLLTVIRPPKLHPVAKLGMPNHSSVSFNGPFGR